MTEKTTPSEKQILIEKEIRKAKNRARFTLIIGVIFVLFTPMLFTSYNVLFDFTTTGQIGDTIGGITAPIVGFVGAILIYFSFNAQLEANKIQINAIENEKKEREKREDVDLVWRIFKEFKDDYNTWQQDKPSLDSPENYDEIIMLTNPIVDALLYFISILNKMNDEKRLDRHHLTFFNRKIDWYFIQIKGTVRYISMNINDNPIEESTRHSMSKDIKRMQQKFNLLQPFIDKLNQITVTPPPPASPDTP